MNTLSGSSASRTTQSYRVLFVGLGEFDASRPSSSGQTIYQIKESLLDDYIRQQLQKSAISVNIA